MTIATPKFFNLPMPSGVMDAVRAFFAKAEQDIVEPQPRAPEQSHAPKIEPVEQEHSSYARLLEKELVQRHLTDVEREDTDMLVRIRSALYATD